jgi:hypothetical protein
MYYGHSIKPTSVRARLIVFPKLSHAHDFQTGNAKIEGLQKSLDMNGIEYDIALMMFFIPYVSAVTRHRSLQDADVCCSYCSKSLAISYSPKCHDLVYT